MRSFPSVGWVVLIAFQILVAVLYLLLPWQVYFTLLFLLILGVVFILRPLWGAYLLIFAVPIVENRIGFISTEMATAAKYKIVPLFLVILLANMICIWLLKVAKIRKEKAFANPLFLPVYALAIYAVFTLFWTPDMFFSLITLTILGANIFAFNFIFSIIDSERIQKRCLGFWLAAGVAAAILTIVSIPTHPQIAIYEDLWRTFQFNIFWAPNVGIRGYAITHPNLTSLMLTLVSSSAVGLFLVANRVIPKCLSLLLLILIVFANCMTFSKAGVGAFLIMGLFLIFFSSTLRKRLFLNTGLLVAGIIALWLVATVFADRFGNPVHAEISLETTSMESVSITTRLEFWKDGFTTLAQKSMFLPGLAVGGYEYYCGRAWAHNILFSLYFDFGVVGVTFACLVVFTIVRLLARTGKTIFIQETYLQKMSLCFCGGIVAIAVHGMVDHFYNNSILWIFLALALPTFILTVREVGAKGKQYGFQSK